MYKKKCKEIYVCMHVYIYIYIYVCVCVCVCVQTPYYMYRNTLVIYLYTFSLHYIYIYFPCIFPAVKLTVIWYWIVASIWLGDLYREASLNTEWTVEKSIKCLVFFIAECTFSPSLTLSARFKKQEGLRQFKCREAELYSQREDLQLYGKRRESKMEMLSVPLCYRVIDWQVCRMHYE